MASYDVASKFNKAKHNLAARWAYAAATRSKHTLCLVKIFAAASITVRLYYEPGKATPLDTRLDHSASHAMVDGFGLCSLRERIGAR